MSMIVKGGEMVFVEEEEEEEPVVETEEEEEFVEVGGEKRLKFTPVARLVL